MSISNNVKHFLEQILHSAPNTCRQKKYACQVEDICTQRLETVVQMTSFVFEMVGKYVGKKEKILITTAFILLNDAVQDHDAEDLPPSRD